MDLDVTDPMSTQTQYPSTNATSAITVTSPAPHNYSTHPGIALSAHHPQGYSTTNHPPSAPFELSHMLPYPGYPYVPNASSHGMTQGYPTAYGPQYSEPRYLPPSVVPYGGHVPHNYHNVPPNWNPQTNAYPDMNLGIHQNTVSQVPNELHYIAYMNTHHRSCRPLNALYGNEVYVHPSRFIPRQTTPLQFQGQSSEWPVNTSQAPPIQSEVIPPAVAIDKNLACTISTSSKQSSDFSSPQDDFGKSEEDGLNLPGCVLPTTPLYNDSSETYSPAAKRLRLTDRLERPSPSQSAVSCTSTPNITVQTESKQQLILSEKDFKSVHEKLYPIRSEWSNFGLALDLPPSTINQISKDHKSVQDCFYKTLDILFKSRELTWSKIIEALRKPTIQQNNLATEIESAIIAMDLPTPAPVSLVGNLSLEKLCRLPVDKVWYQLGLWLGVKEYRLIDIKTNNENIELLFKAFLESLYGSTDYRRLCELFTDVQKEQAQRLLESETYDDFIKLFPQDKRIDARKIVDISKALFPRLLTALIKVGKRDVAENICSKKGMKIVYMLIIMIQN